MPETHPTIVERQLEALEINGTTVDLELIPIPLFVQAQVTWLALLLSQKPSWCAHWNKVTTYGVYHLAHG